MPRGFKRFAMRGAAIDVAVGLVVGGAFSKVISSLINDIVMPPLGLLLGHADYSDLFIDLSGRSYPTLAAAKAAGAPTINYGLFIHAVANFLFVAGVVFWVVRRMNRLSR